MEAEGTARLTDRIPAERAVAASVSRREIRDILQDGDAAPELVIDVAAGDGSQEHGTISITWSREDLERLLEGATENDVVLTFDRNEVAAALDEVEAHGLRTQAAVFAVAAAGALGSGASIANAMLPSIQDGGASQPAAALTTPTTQDNAAQTALQARSQALNEQYGLTAGGVNDPAVQALEARGEAMNAQFGLGAPGDATVTDASTGGYVAPTQDAAQAALLARSEAMNQLNNLDDPAVQALQARGEAMNAEFGLGGVPSDRTVSDASTGGYATPPAATDGSSFSIQAPSPEDALIAGAAALMIAGAAFTVRKGGPRHA
jgi:hypothetical protein